MSLREMTWAMEQKLPCAQKFVLLMIANNALAGEFAEIDTARLAEQCGLTELQVDRALLALEKAGLLRLLRQVGMVSGVVLSAGGGA